MHHILDESQDNVIGVQVSGTLQRADYEDITALLRQRIEQHGKICILFEMKGFEGWKPTALWEDVKFDVRYNKAMKRAAMVGDKPWENWVTKLAAPFAHAEVKYFERSQLEEAWTWIRECD